MMNFRYALALALPLLPQAQTGTLRGTVTSNDDKPVAGAIVSYSRMPVFQSPREGMPRYRLLPGELEVRYWITTDSAGTFQVPGLPEGKYLLCVEVPNQPFLNPCKWSVAPFAVLPDGGDVFVPMVLSMGVFLKVRIDDPLRLLPRTRSSPLDFPHVFVGVVAGTGAYYGLSEVNVDSAGRDFRIAIPSATPLKLHLSSPRVKLSDSTGNAIDSVQTRVPFQALPSQDQSFRFQIAGTITP